MKPIFLLVMKYIIIIEMIILCSGLFYFEWNPGSQNKVNKEDYKQAKEIGCDSSVSLFTEDVQYKCDFKTKEWVIDKEATTRSRNYENHKSELNWALRTRVLNDKEMAEVKQFGVNLIIKDNILFDEEEKEREFNDNLLQQYKLREEKNRRWKSDN